MPSKKKVVLFLVEGQATRPAIRGPVNLLIQSSFNSDSASFHGDVTTAQIEYPTFYRIKDSIRDTVKTFVEDYLRDTNPGYKAKDIHCLSISWTQTGRLLMIPWLFGRGWAGVNV